MMISKSLLGLACSFLLILIPFLQTCSANEVDPHYCSPSACGIIRNISLPFRLKDDPKHCGFHSYELECENNVTFFYMGSQKYAVKAINYDNRTIRLADVSVNINSNCSFPHYSLYSRILPYPYDSEIYKSSSSLVTETDAAWPINLMSCPHPINNSSSFSFTEITTDCPNIEGGTRHTYVKVGHMNAADVIHNCRVDLIVMTSWKFKDEKNVSLSEIHDSLLYGFQLRWYGPPLPFSFRFRGRKPPAVILVQLVILTIIIVVLVAGLIFPAKSIIASIFVLGPFLYWRGVRFAYISMYDTETVIILNVVRLTAFIYAAKNIILFPCAIGLLLYKFRRRHLSVFDKIEDFLQSDNKLMPIRYSYSDIKRMTKSFREKLGQGGYGSVYKGKLRSGHDVAVKLLENSKANGQDFINEIATIGRIHHVNVVGLVGYCAEGSKRALVYDFMPNGSLEKYIFGREGANPLNWDKKFDIAVGVARGIEYLHRGCDIQILHFDIKPHNILLDDKFVPKISDFGLAKFFSTDKNAVTLTAARGTIGYVAPELLNRGIGRVSYKADVYSYGMLLMDLVGLKSAMTGDNGTSSKYFPYWIYDCFEQGREIEIGNTDTDDDDTSDRQRNLAKKMTIVALWCIQMSPDERPSMNRVLEMLEGGVERLQVPNRVVTEDHDWTTSSLDSVSLLDHDVSTNVEIIVQAS